MPRSPRLRSLSVVALLGCGSSTAAPTKPADAAVESSLVARHDAANSHDAASSRENGLALDAGATSDAEAQDASMDVDNGAPSTTYPAPHPSLPQLTNLVGGPVLKTPKVYLVFYPGYPYVTQLQSFATSMTQATFWAGSTSQYGVGPLAFGGTINLTGETAPTMTTQQEIVTWVGSELASGAFGTPDPEGIYTLFYPEGTTITQPNPVLTTLSLDSCVAFGGYHDNVAVSLTDGGTPTEFSFAVIPTCDAVVDDLTAVVSHEWVESATDPFLTSGGTFTLVGGPDSAYFTIDADHAVWALLGGGEAGDLCELEGNAAYVTPSDVGFTVQRTWSNLLARASHDPCAPDLPNTPFFAAAPVLTETETVTSELIGGTIVTKGVTIAALSSKTIEVDLFSDSDTGGPFTVEANDVIHEYYGSYGLAQTLAFAWDRTQGVNGEKLHLTITVTGQSIIDGVHVFSITATQGNQQFVWPGLVQE